MSSRSINSEENNHDSMDVCDSPSESSAAYIKTSKTVFTPKQLLYLEEMFYKKPFPNSKEKSRIAEHLNLTFRNVQTWFQNKRAKSRRKEKKRREEQEKLHQPKPPPFWPKNLRFDSKFTDATTPDTDANYKGEELSSPLSDASTSNSSPNSSTSSTPNTTISSTLMTTDNPNLSKEQTQEQILKAIKQRFDKTNKLSKSEECHKKISQKQTFTLAPLQKNNSPMFSTPSHQSIPTTSPKILHSLPSHTESCSYTWQMPYSTHCAPTTQHNITIQYSQSQPAYPARCLSSPGLTLLPIVPPISVEQGMSHKITVTHQKLPVHSIVTPKLPPSPPPPNTKHDCSSNHKSHSTSEASITKSLLLSSSASLYNDNALLLLANCAVSVASTRTNSNSESDHQYLSSHLSSGITTKANSTVGTKMAPNDSSCHATTATTSCSVCTIRVPNSTSVVGICETMSTHTNQATKAESMQTSLCCNTREVIPSTRLNSDHNGSIENPTAVKSKETHHQSTSLQTASNFKQSPKVVGSPFPLADIDEEEWHVIESTLTPNLKKAQSFSEKPTTTPESSTTVTDLSLNFNGQTTTVTPSVSLSRKHIDSKNADFQVSPQLKCATKSLGNAAMFTGSSSLTIEHPSYINDPDGAFSLLAKKSEQK